MPRRFTLFHPICTQLHTFLFFVGRHWVMVMGNHVTTSTFMMQRLCTASLSMRDKPAWWTYAQMSIGMGLKDIRPDIYEENMRKVRPRYTFGESRTLKPFALLPFLAAQRWWVHRGGGGTPRFWTPTTPSTNCWPEGGGGSGRGFFLGGGVREGRFGGLLRPAPLTTVGRRPPRTGGGGGG